MYEDFSDWVQDLLSEGYDLSDYTWDEMYDIYEGVFSGGGRNREIGTRSSDDPELQARRRRATRQDAQRPSQSTIAARRRKATKEQEEQERMERLISNLIDSPTKSRRHPMGSETPAEKPQAPSRSGARVIPAGAKVDPLDALIKSVRKEDYEIYELVLDHLIEEGFVDDYDSAETMMNYMSEEWLEDIVEGKKALSDRQLGAMSKRARQLAFNAASETHSDETGIGIVPRGDNTARQLRTLARVGGKKVKGHIKRGYEQGRNYDPYYQELNSRNPSRNRDYDG